MTPTAQKREAPRKGKGNGTLFVCDCDPDAKEVYLVGEFNNWDPTADRMAKWKGVFRRRLNLEPGVYQYKFLVDGRWHTDSSADEHVPNEFGTQNSVIRV
jgi:1,4-alpha-glucan branching enzyme